MTDNDHTAAVGVPVGGDTPAWPPRVTVTPFKTTDDVWWADGKPRCTRHRGVCLVPATAVGLAGEGHVCHECMRETRPVGDDTPAPTAGQWTVDDGEIRYRYAPGAWVGLPTRDLPDGAYDALVALVRRAVAAPDLTARVAELETVIVAGLVALQLTREYVGEDVLPRHEGWSWFDWSRRAEAALVRDTPEE